MSSTNNFVVQSVSSGFTSVAYPQSMTTWDTSGTTSTTTDLTLSLTYYRAYRDMFGENSWYYPSTTASGYGPTLYSFAFAWGMCMGDAVIAPYLVSIYYDQEIDGSDLASLYKKILNGTSNSNAVAVLGPSAVISVIEQALITPQNLRTLDSDWSIDAYSSVKSNDLLTPLANADFTDNGDGTYTISLALTEVEFRDFIGPYYLYGAFVTGYYDRSTLTSISNESTLKDAGSALTSEFIGCILENLCNYYLIWAEIETSNSYSTCFQVTDTVLQAEGLTRVFEFVDSSTGTSTTFTSINQSQITQSNIVQDKNKAINSNYSDFDLTPGVLSVSSADTSAAVMIYQAWLIWNTNQSANWTNALSSLIDMTATDDLYFGVDLLEEAPSTLANLLDTWGIQIYFNYTSHYITGSIVDLTQFDAREYTWWTTFVRNWYRTYDVSNTQSFSYTTATGITGTIYMNDGPSYFPSDPTFIGTSSAITNPFVVSSLSWPSALPSSYFTSLCASLVYKIDSSTYLSGTTFMQSLMNLVNYYTESYQSTLANLEKEDENPEEEDDDSGLSTVAKIGIIILIIAVIVILAFLIVYLYKKYHG